MRSSQTDVKRTCPDSLNIPEDKRSVTYSSSKHKQVVLDALLD